MGTGRRTARWLVLGGVLVLLAGCGGGGSDDATGTDTNAKHGSSKASVPAPALDDATNRAMLGIRVSADLSLIDGPFPTFDDSAGSGTYGDDHTDVYTLTTKPVQAKTVSGYGQDDFGTASRVSATIDSTASPSDAGFGVVCRMQDGENYYRFGVGNDGTYSIARVVADEATLLTSDDGSWSESDLIDPAARTFDVEAICDGKDLTLYVDGEKIDSVTDDTFDSGSVAIFTETFAQPNASIAVTAFSAEGLADPDAVSDEAYGSWKNWFKTTPREITRCELRDRKESQIRPLPVFVTRCGDVAYAEMADGDGAKAAFGQLIDASDRDVEKIRGFPNCRKDTNVSGPLPEAAGTPFSGGVACLEDGSRVAIIWWNDLGIVGVVNPKADNLDFTWKWAPDWWPLTAVPKPGD
jgi:hypothetical protein